MNNYQIISLISLIFLFSGHLSAYGEPLLVPYYPDSADQELASLIFGNCQVKQIDENSHVLNSTIQAVCNQDVKDDVSLSHSVANGMQSVQNAFENSP
jgi:hypothetical protein